MEPVTHALASLALAQAGLRRQGRLATPLLIVAGLAPDVDYASAAGGARAYLYLHRALFHSVLGGAALAAALAALAWTLGRRYKAASLRYSAALGLCAMGVVAHLLLDVCNSPGILLGWPFTSRAITLDLLPRLDPWLLLLLAAGVLLPWLFRLIIEEIGARAHERVSRGAMAMLIVLGAYLGARAVLHVRAENVLSMRTYHRRIPEAVAALPEAVSPLAWRGLVSTDETYETIEISFAPGAYFDPDRSRSFYKPESSPALESAETTASARLLLRRARFPIAETETTADGYRVTLRDLRESLESVTLGETEATVNMDYQYRVRRDWVHFGPAGRFD